MKKFFTICIAIISSIAIQGCSNEKNVCIQAPLNTKKTNFVSVEDATKNVNRFIESTAIPTRSGKKRDIAEVITLGGFGESRSDNSDVDAPLVYLFNFNNNEGFALVSGDARVGDILAFVEEGNLDPTIGVDNPGFAIFLEMADIYYRLKTGLPINEEILNNYQTRSGDDPWEDYDPEIDADYVEYSDWTKVNSSDTGSILPCKWNQGYPLNRYCETSEGETALVGCVAIAVGQIMYYHAHNCTYNGTNYDWDVISTYVKANNYTAAGLDMAAKLVADLGRSENLDMDYGTEASGAYSENVPRTFANFGYTNSGIIEASNGRFNLDNGPYYMSGTRLASSNLPDNNLGIYSPDGIYSGHAWVIDASMEQMRYIYTYLYNGILAKTEVEYRHLCHCNWGWGGSCDGYFLGDVFKINECIIPDTTVQNITWNYNMNLTEIRNIRP